MPSDQWTKQRTIFQLTPNLNGSTIARGWPFFLQHLDIQFLSYYYTINGNDRNESVVPCLKILSKNYNLSIGQLIAFRDAVPKITIFGTYVWVTPTEIELEGMLFFPSSTRTILNPLPNENSKDCEKIYPCGIRRTAIS